MADVPVPHKTALLSDNGSGYISKPFNEYLEQQQIKHIFAAPLHPQTCGKFERLNRTAKAKLKLVIYSSPDELEQAVAEFQQWYNHERYHQACGRVASAGQPAPRGRLRGPRPSGAQQEKTTAGPNRRSKASV